MKGILKYTIAGWFVWYQVRKDEITSGYDSIPLHPSEKVDDSFRDKEVEFKIVYYLETGIEEPFKVAELVKAYPYLKGTMNLCEYIIEKKTGKMTEEEWQAAENNPKPKYTPGKGISFYIENEISDEEIEKAANEYAWNYQCPSEVKMCKHDIISAWNNAIKWYKEQFKKK